MVAYVVGDAYLRTIRRFSKLYYKGVRLTYEAQPELMALIGDALGSAGIRRLDGVWVEAGGGAGALIGRRDWLWRRRLGLTIGLLTLAHLDEQDLRAVLAHEAGHLSDRNRMRRRLWQRRERIRRRLRWWRRVRPMDLYWRWLLRSTRLFAVTGEREADARAVALCGLDATVIALQRVHAASALHAAAVASFLRPSYERGYAPPTLWPAYEALWQDREKHVSGVLGRLLAADDDALGTHPGLAERTHGRPLELAPSLRGTVPLREFHRLDERTTFLLTRSQSRVALQTIDWPEFLARATPPAACDLPTMLADEEFTDRANQP